MPRIRRTDEALKGGRRGKKGSVPKTIADYRESAKDKWWQFAHAVMSGQPVKTAGPTGKAVTKILSEAHQVKIWETAGRKLFGDVTMQAIKAEVEDVTARSEPVDNRQLARVIANILSHAQVDEEQPRPTYVHPSEKAQLLIGRDAVIEVSAGQPEAAPSAPVGFHGEERKGNRAVMPSSGPKVVRQMPRRIR